MDRRDLLVGMGMAVGSAFSRTVDAAAPGVPADTLRFFPGFKTFDVKTTGATLHGVVGGSGPPLPLLHGAPQSHVSWRLVAPQFAKSYTVIAPDLRGYGDSSKPADGDGHASYSKRAMALDQPR
jgi:haloacetate dehalogenase